MIATWALLVLLVGGEAPPEGRAAELLATGNRYYEAGSYAEAAAAYERILEYGVQNEVVHFNLGNALFKQGLLGPAILNYERALVLMPTDPEALENLAYAGSLTVDRVEVPEPSFPVLALAWVLHRTTPGEDAVLLLASLYLLGATSAAAVLLRSWKRRPLLYVAVLLLLLSVWSGGSLLWKETSRARSDRAVVMAEKVDALSGPADDFTPLFTVHEGLRVRIRNRRGEWAQIALPNGLSGWVQADAVERV